MFTITEVKQVEHPEATDFYYRPEEGGWVEVSAEVEAFYELHVSNNDAKFIHDLLFCSLSSSSCSLSSSSSNRICDRSTKLLLCDSLLYILEIGL